MPRQPAFRKVEHSLHIGKNQLFNNHLTNIMSQTDIRIFTVCRTEEVDLLLLIVIGHTIIKLFSAIRTGHSAQKHTDDTTRRRCSCNFCTGIKDSRSIMAGCVSEKPFHSFCGLSIFFLLLNEFLVLRRLTVSR